MKTSETIIEITKALCESQRDMKAPEKDKKGNFGMYSSIDAIWRCCQAILPLNGLVVLQDLCSVDGGITVETRIVHTSGEWMSFGPLFLPCDRTPHKVASSSTYARRYSLCSAICINGDADDDAQDANALQKSLIDKKTGEVKKEQIFITKERLERLNSMVNKFDDAEFLKKLYEYFSIKSIGELLNDEAPKFLLCMNEKKLPGQHD